jgi:hypothetical protein
MIPLGCQLPAALILMVSAIALCRAVAHDLCNTTMLLFFYKINSSFILFTTILFVAYWCAHGCEVWFLQ